MDMGYKRRYHETDKFIAEELKFQVLREQKAERVWFSTGPKTSRDLLVSNEIVNQVVVISEKNEGKKDNRTDMINSICQLDWVNIYYLTGGIHPNNYGNNAKNEIVVNDSEFERLYSDTILRLA
jgi:hypothetical protein